MPGPVAGEGVAHYGMVDARTTEELDAWLRLAAEPGLGRAAARHLLKELGLPQHVFAATAATLARHVPREVAARLAAPAEPAVRSAVQAAVELLSQPGYHLITLADAHYPASLFDTHDPPILLFVRGNPHLLLQPSLAVVGARSATEGGKEDARAFAQYLARRGWTIISGLARGIDAAAHEGALQSRPDGGSTIAVLASGLDIVYPRQHAQLAEQIAGEGALVTEYPPGTPAQPFRFPDRNRLVAALSRGVLVVEAAAQSGSLLTARLALEYGREVFAIPGSIHAPLSRGCHALIRQGAKLVEQGLDIEEELQRTGAVPPLAVPAAPLRRPEVATSRPASRMLKDPLVVRLLTALGYDPASADQLCRRSGLDFSRIAAILTELELNDIVHRLDDGRYQRRQQGIIYD